MPPPTWTPKSSPPWGRLHRAGELDADAVEAMLTSLADALYVELAVSHSSTLVTTDRRLRAVPVAEVVLA